jgi:hypothetical protein
VSDRPNILRAGTPITPSTAPERAYRSIGYWLLLLPVLMMAGFWVPYFSSFPTFDVAITPAVHIHAVLLFGLVALLVVQPLAIRQRAFKMHRRLGQLSFVLMPLVLSFVVLMILKDYREHLAAGVAATAARDAEYLSCGGLVLLAGFYALSIRSIRKGIVANHLRWMICLALALSPAGLSRLLGYGFDVRQSLSQAVSFAVINLSLLGLIAYDRRRGSSASVFGLAFCAYLAFEAGWIALGRPT